MNIPSRRRFLAGLLVVAALAAAAGGAWRYATGRPLPVREFPMLEKTDIPAAVAVAADGTVWFTIEFSSAIGRWRDGRMERLPKGKDNVEPLGLGVDRAGGAWFTDAPALRVARMAPDGSVTGLPLGTPIARLGRLAVGPDDAVWFAESTAYSVTELRGGQLHRHLYPSPRGGPYGVAVAPDGTAWATLQGANALLRIGTDGTQREFEIPTRGSSPTDVAVDAQGSVWFLELRGARIGRLREGRFTEYELPAGGVVPSGLAIAPDGTPWFGTLRGGVLGRVRGERVELLPLPRADARIFSLAADAAGNLWYTDLSGFLGMLPAGSR